MPKKGGKNVSRSLAVFWNSDLERGLPAAMNIYERFKKADPTLSDLEALKKIAIDPDKEE